MSEGKKYTAQQAAIAVLAKTAEMLKNYDFLRKSEEIKPPEQNVTPPDKVQAQVPPDQNPKEQAEGNNKEWGTAPETYGHLKLAKFIGYMHAKRKSKAPPAGVQ